MKQQIGLVYLGDDRKIAAQIDRLVNEIPFIKFSTVSNLGKVNEGFAPTDRVVVLVDREAASEFPWHELRLERSCGQHDRKPRRQR